MQIKKNPKANLENYTRIFMQLGLVLALLVVYLAIEKKTYDRVIGDLGPVVLNMEDDEEQIEIEQVKPPEQKAPPPPAPDKIEVVEDEEEIEETVIESTETDETEAVEVEIIEVEEEEEVMEDVPFAIIEDVPVYPGCKGNKAKLRACLQEKIQKLVMKKFNSELASDLGLSPGVKRIFVMFKIDKNGNITDVQARAPHVKLQQEAIRVVKLIPKMTPGKQRGRPVGVKYSLPIAFRVE
ncbi:MAG: energy transducer TonB [Bacteroidetes bacterium]|nr:energy transducer TonB [Bacteroidota bacterium]